MWESYIDELARRNDIDHVNFRSKRNGWGILFEVNYLNLGHYTRKLNVNLYGKLFLNALMSRPSCYGCKFKMPNSRSDLTLGDAWGVAKFAPEMFDSRGVSVVFLHTDKGRNFFEQTNLTTRQVRFIDATWNNLSSTISESTDPRRVKFFADFAADDDKYAAMEKYYFQDDAELRKQIGKLNRRAFRVAYREIVASVRQKFTENILVATPFDDDAKKSLIERFTQNNPNGTIYFLRLNDKGELVCREEFSSLDLPIKSEVAALKDFAEKFNVTQVVASEPLNLDVPAVAEWLKVCGLPVQVLAQV